MFRDKDYVSAVWRERSFSKAAARLYISQPSLSAKIKKIEEERRALVSCLRTLCLRERILGGTVTRTMVGNSLRMTVTDRVDGRTRTLFVPAERQEEVSRWNENWKEMRGLLRALSELQRTELRVSLGQESAAATSVRDVVPQGLRRKRPHSRG